MTKIELFITANVLNCLNLMSQILQSFSCEFKWTFVNESINAQISIHISNEFSKALSNLLTMYCFFDSKVSPHTSHVRETLFRLFFDGCCLVDMSAIELSSLVVFEVAAPLPISLPIFRVDIPAGNCFKVNVRLEIYGNFNAIYLTNLQRFVMVTCCRNTCIR